MSECGVKGCMRCDPGESKPESKTATIALIFVIVVCTILIPFRVVVRLLALAWEFSGEASAEIVDGLREETE